MGEMETNLLIREWLNGGLIPLNISILLIIAHSLWETRRKYGGSGWWDAPGAKSACALWWIFLADLIRATLAFVILHTQRLNGVHAIRQALYLNDVSTLLYIGAAVIATLATFRLIYALSPARWGHNAWIATAIFTAVFFLLVTLFG